MQTTRLDRADTPESTRVERRDAFDGLRPPVERDGRLYLEGVVAAPGVMEYADGQGGIIRELVRPEALADPFVSSLVGVPLVVEHPVDEAGQDIEVNYDNTHMLRVGTVLRAELTKGCQVKIWAVVDTEKGRAYVQDRKVSGLSPHYFAMVSRAKPGDSPDFMYGEFDTVQTSRERPDHVAIVMSPRGNDHGTHLRLDSAGRLASTLPSPSSSEDQMELTAELLRKLMGDKPMSADDLIRKIYTLQQVSEEEQAEKILSEEAGAEEQVMESEDAAGTEADPKKADPEKAAERMDMVPMLEKLDAMSARLDGMVAEIADAVCAKMDARYDMAAKTDTAEVKTDTDDKGAEVKTDAGEVPPKPGKSKPPSETVRIDSADAVTAFFRFD